MDWGNPYGLLHAAGIKSFLGQKTGKDRPSAAAAAGPGGMDMLGQLLGNYSMRSGQPVDVGRVEKFLSAQGVDPTKWKSMSDVSGDTNVKQVLANLIPSYMAQTPASGLDPMAMTMFMQKAILPYLQQQQSQLAQDVKGMPAGVADAYKTLGDTTQALELEQPQMDAFMKAIAAQQQMAQQQTSSTGGLPPF